MSHSPSSRHTPRQHSPCTGSRGGRADTYTPGDLRHPRTRLRGHRLPQHRGWLGSRTDCRDSRCILGNIYTALSRHYGNTRRWGHRRHPGTGPVCSSRTGLRYARGDIYTQQLVRCSHKRLPDRRGCWSRGQSYSWCTGLRCSLVDTCRWRYYERRH